MARVNIYIRKEDEALWNAIEDVPDWLHKALNPQMLIINTDGRKINEVVKPVPFDILKQGKGGRYNGDTPLVGPEILKTPEEVKKKVETIPEFNGFISKAHSARKRSNKK